FIAGVWFGNDDYTTMNQMTGGSLPAQTWHDIMAFAHQGVELKPIPGLGPQATGRQQVAEGKTKDGAPEPPSNRPSVLTKRGADALVRVERLMDDATRALAAGGSQPTKASDAAPTRRQGSVASASDQPPAGQIRGN
ncbi:MAG: penicillin-binding protein, partial [Alphaproteobacteria bacterium]|nr:penicillin-binding protein [Alphaproteobacteria bacterium]